MDPIVILGGVSTAIEVVQKLINAGKDAAPLITTIFNRITNKKPADVTQDDLDAVAAKSDQMTADIMRPLDAD
jgi:ATP-dependent 26S proteasome regulatory subunit